MIEFSHEKIFHNKNIFIFRKNKGKMNNKINLTCFLLASTKSHVMDLYSEFCFAFIT